MFSNEDVADYTNLTSEELDRVAAVFEANAPDRITIPDRPLTEAGYTLIWNVTVDMVESYVNKVSETINTTEEKEESVMRTENNTATSNYNETTNKEEVAMGTVKEVKENVSAAVEEMMDKFAQAKENIKLNAGETKEEFIEKTDDSLNVMKGALGTVLNVLDTVLGYSMIKNSILSIMEAGTDGKSSKKDLFKMAKKCREEIEFEIEELLEFGDEEDFKKAVQLKALIGEDGEVYSRSKNIFEAFVSGCIWIAKKVTRKLRKWFQVDEEKSVIGAICRSIAGFVGVLKAGVQIVWNAVKFAASFIISGAILIIDAIVHAVKSIVSKFKDWISKKGQKVEDDEFDELDEELEFEIEE